MGGLDRWSSMGRKRCGGIRCSVDSTYLVIPQDFVPVVAREGPFVEEFGLVRSLPCCAVGGILDPGPVVVAVLVAKLEEGCSCGWNGRC